MQALSNARANVKATPFRRRLVAAKVAAAEPSLKTDESEKIFTEAQDLMPGGVNSPVRAFKSVGGLPVVFDRVKGAKVFDVDGNEYIDYVGTWGPAIVGHANDEVLDAIKAQLDKGTSYGAPCALENEMAKMVIDRVPCVEMVRFCSSGTEACISALRLMRAYTGREKVIKFVGCFHGHGDAFLVQAGSGVATLGLPDSPGVPEGSTAGTLCATYNDLDSVKAIFEANKGEIAGLILEPVVGNSGYIEPTQEFLEGLRSMCTEEGAVLCFDEVMTGFRISRGCAQEHFGITPDLCTMGKVIGGGLPVGAFGGKREIMETVAPAGPMYQSGTLSGNPLAMISGMKTLEIMDRPGAYEHLDKVTKKLINGILDAGKEYNIPVTGGSISGVSLFLDQVKIHKWRMSCKVQLTAGMFGFFFTDKPVTCFEDAAAHADGERFAKYHRMMLERGVYLAPSMYEAGFTSLAHTEEDIEKTLAAVRDVFSQL